MTLLSVKGYFSHDCEQEKQVSDATNTSTKTTQECAKKTLASPVTRQVPGLKSRSWCRLIRCLFHLLIDKLFYAKLHSKPLVKTQANASKIASLKQPANQQTAAPVSSSEEDDVSSSEKGGVEIIPAAEVPTPEFVLQHQYSDALTVLNSPGERLGAATFTICCAALEPESKPNQQSQPQQLCFFAPSREFTIVASDEELSDKIKTLPKDLNKLAFPVILSGYDDHIVQIFIDVNEKKLELFDPMGRAAHDDLQGTRLIRGMHVDLATLIEKLIEHYEIQTVHENTQQYQKDMHSCGLRGILATHLFLSKREQFPNTSLTNANFDEHLFRQVLFDKLYENLAQKLSKMSKMS